MEPKRRWQLPLILTVIALTIYNVLPTLFYYAQPLQAPISTETAQRIGSEIVKRVDSLELDSLEWIHSFCELIHVQPQTISASIDNPGHISIAFAKTSQAASFRQHFPRAAALIPSFPLQMGLAPETDNPKEILIQRRIPVRLAEISNLFEYIPKMANGEISPQYQGHVSQRLEAIETALQSQKIFAPQTGDSIEQAQTAAASVATIAKLYSCQQDLAVHYARFQSEESSAQWLISLFDNARDALKADKMNKELSPERQEAIEAQELKLAAAASFVKKHSTLFQPDKLAAEYRHPLFSKPIVDWGNGQIHFALHPSVADAMVSQDTKSIVDRLLIHELAKISNRTAEEVKQSSNGYAISLHKLENMTGLLSIKLDKIGYQVAQQTLQALRAQWHPTHPDLSQLPIVTMDEYHNLSLQDKALCIVVAAPDQKESSFSGLNSQSVYVLAIGFDKILNAYASAQDSHFAILLRTEFDALVNLLASHGFGGYRATLPSNNSADFIFENRYFFKAILDASLEDFTILSARNEALLELSNHEQRLLTLNKIEDKLQEDLIKWDDEYRAAQVSLNPSAHFDVPKPTKNVFWNNLKLSATKFLRGDDRKILRWGLDLSGGKTIEIELRDQNNRIVDNESDLKQGINELFNRVNKMGVSDVSIRQVGNHIVLDFPGGQALSAADLVKASSMMFHVVNEKFGPTNPSLGSATNQFLQDVWNEAVVTNRKDPQQIQAIAYRHLYGSSDSNNHSQSDAAHTLLEQGLKLANPESAASDQALDMELSKIVVIRGSDPQQWHGQTHPLMIAFHNHALEGAQLDQIRASYDPAKGNYLTFEVNGSTARSNLYAWTSQFSKEKIIGTPREDYSYGRGWRMAVLLNESVISSPTLESALKDSASISGSFSQREVQQLASDLKAGSLTFTPRILSEKNVSPELGQQERMQGITATIAALILVIICMLAYYRFAGLVASIAVLFNLLIMWATLQNLGASLSLASIAGIILTVGMAVDANVLVFERLKEEFALTQNIAQAIRAGYAKAFSAILDSNVTTIIAALILLNFDAGPIKAFAISMIIGIASSMFTALFMTRFYFNQWLKNPKHQVLSMANWIHASKIDFLKKTKLSFAIALSIIGIGSSLMISERSTLFGMDFTGGYAVHIELDPATTSDALTDVHTALETAGLRRGDFQLRQNSSSALRILLAASLEQQDKPFAGMPLSVEGTSYQQNPRINWVVTSLENAGLKLTPQSLASLEANWSSMSGQMSESMRNNALLGLLIAFISIFFYIAWRFEYKYAISTILCLLHDVCITLSCMGLLHAIGVPIQIDLNTIAALMTIIGYSLNDTIIIFDRIREDSQLHPYVNMRKIIFTALNATLSRTAITSGTTLVVLLALLFLGGASIFSFSLVMVIGVIFGTLSSWFIASPLLLYFHQKEESKEELVQIS